MGSLFQVAHGQAPIPETAPVAAGANSPVPASPPFTSPDIQPTLADKLTAKPIALKKKLCATDPLLRPPFAAAPPETLKGMASGIRAVELDIPNRIMAVRYLGTVDCVTYPEAKDMLIQTMQQDPSEEVRYEAVMALRLMLTHGCNLDSPCECPRCSQRKRVAMETEKYAAKPKKICPPVPCARRHKTCPPRGRCAKLIAKQKRNDCCRGCCSADAMNALSKVAYGHDGTCYFEPSERVREAAIAGMGLCEVYPTPAAEVPVIEESKPIQQQETAPPVVPPVEEGPQARSAKKRATIRQISATALAPAVEGLKGYCVVSLKAKEFVAADPQFSAV
ncbi:MAG TPA: HEAT repeat domain-containing protein, partial [Planctomycetaceae bacterium]|nr:HEAT repeat domain-containing protein [Planctomycetaceae bacterium]